MTHDFASFGRYNIHTEMPLSGTSMGHADLQSKEIFRKFKYFCNSQAVGMGFAAYPAQRHLIPPMRKDFIAATTDRTFWHETMDRIKEPKLKKNQDVAS